MALLPCHTSRLIREDPLAVFDETMSPDDHMLTADLASYFQTARQGLTCVLDGLAAAGRSPESISTVLDFGSGYGRIYRALAAGFPQAQLTACDLMEPAARFCAETFGGDWARSSEVLDEIRLPRTYDLIWLGSVFTHLPAHRWVSLLDFLARATNAGGIVIFTTHGATAIEHIENRILARNPHMIAAERFAAMKRTLQLTGFDFIPNKPAAIRHQNDRGIKVSEGEYGFSFASEEWVARLVDRLPPWRLVKYAAPGWGRNHDAATIVRA